MARRHIRSKNSTCPIHGTILVGASAVGVNEQVEGDITLGTTPRRGYGKHNRLMAIGIYFLISPIITPSDHKRPGWNSLLDMQSETVCQNNAAPG